MSDPTVISGSCLCGSVGYEVRGAARMFQYCHCERCRKFTGSAHASNFIVDPDQFSWTRGADDVGRFELAEAKDFATSFCKRCGSSLPWLTRTGRAVVIPAGTFDTDPQQQPVHNIYSEERAPWYADPAKLPWYDQLPPRKPRE
jgi:hypothetical protein